MKSVVKDVEHRHNIIHIIQFLLSFDNSLLPKYAIQTNAILGKHHASIEQLFYFNSNSISLKVGLGMVYDWNHQQ
jgi:hypothetical protein